MAKESLTILTGIVLDEDSDLSLEELARACGIEREWILQLVAEGVIAPANEAPEHWRFQGESLRRARTASRLAHDLDINLSGIALALDLLDEIESLRARLRRLKNLP
jgi:chaperone modulatory protein CbpM